METYKKCCFIGHRSIEVSQKLVEDIRIVVENLILNENVEVFLFGSKSNFNNVCHMVVSELKEKYQSIKRIFYTCTGEAAILQSKLKEMEEAFFCVLKKEVHLMGFEEEFHHKTKYVSGKAAYIERNRAMIDDSDFCVFYYDDKYLPQKRKQSKNSIFEYQPNSGTAVAFKYAIRKNKTIINLKNN